jgi:hypothetical protein
VDTAPTLQITEGTLDIGDTQPLIQELQKLRWSPSDTLVNVRIRQHAPHGLPGTPDPVALILVIPATTFLTQLSLDIYRGLRAAAIAVAKKVRTALSMHNYRRFGVQIDNAVFLLDGLSDEEFERAFVTLCKTYSELEITPGPGAFTFMVWDSNAGTWNASFWGYWT